MTRKQAANAFIATGTACLMVWIVLLAVGMYRFHTVEIVEIIKEVQL